MMPSDSTTWRVSSLVGWSPHSLISGMETSSTKMVMSLPPMGPNVRPPRFSRLDSMASWNMPGVVALEKLTRLKFWPRSLHSARYMSAVDVLAVPGPPTSSTGWLLRPWTSFRTCTARVESIVGTSRLGKSSVSESGYSQEGGFTAAHGTPAWDVSRKCSNTVRLPSSPSADASAAAAAAAEAEGGGEPGTFAPATVCRRAWKARRSSGSSTPPMVQERP
mmetsp:Transcript_17159/g.65009  ORF Transcript_17159/g.65009 Transcript_17159/m.65009 type:complete len:220 (+) Transcript_17159:2413-3072(+)